MRKNSDNELLATLKALDSQKITTKQAFNIIKAIIRKEKICA